MAKAEDKKIRVEIAYLGEDKSYWDSLKAIYQSDNPSMQFFFFEWFNRKEDTVSAAFEKVRQTPLSIVYFDFCKRDAEMLYLTKVIVQDNSTKNMVSVGLIDNLTSKDVIREAILAGIKLIQIKGTEVRAAVFQPLDVATGMANIPAYAVAKLNHTTTLRQRFRLRSVSATNMRIESDRPFKPNDDVRMVTSFLKNARLFSHWHKVKTCEDSNLYSNGRFIHDLDFYFIDPKHILDAAKEQERLAQAEAEKKNKKAGGAAKAAAAPEAPVPPEDPKVKAKREAEAKARLEQDVADIKKNLEQYVSDNRDRYIPKKIKVMVLDKKLDILAQAEKNIFYDYPFKMYLQTYLKDPEKELKHRLPNVITMILDAAPKLDEEAAQEYSENLQKVVKVIEEIKAKLSIKTKLPDDWEAPVSDIRAGLLALRATPESAESKRKVQEALDQYFAKKTANDLDALKNIMAAIKKIPNYSPVVLIFNGAGLTSEGLRKDFGHNQIICQNGLFNFKQLLGLAQIFQKNIEAKKDKELNDKLNALKKKDPAKFRKYTKADLEGGVRAYFDEKKSDSVVDFENQVQLLSISESELTFNLIGKDKYDIPMYSIFELNFPVNMWVTVLPFPKSMLEGNKKPEGFRAFIHMVGEIEKRDLRRFVNSVFFADKDEAKRKELAEFEAMKQRILGQRAPEEGTAPVEGPAAAPASKEAPKTPAAPPADPKKKAS